MSVGSLLPVAVGSVLSVAVGSLLPVAVGSVPVATSQSYRPGPVRPRAAASVETGQGRPAPTRSVYQTGEYDTVVPV